MAVQVKWHSVTAMLTDGDYELLEVFAAEQGIEDVSAALPALLHDQLWDMQFSQGREKMDAMARKALEGHN